MQYSNFVPCESEGSNVIDLRRFQRGQLRLERAISIAAKVVLHAVITPLVLASILNQPFLTDVTDWNLNRKRFHVVAGFVTFRP
jgi:hypothetical protein